MSNVIDLTGQRFGRLIVLKRVNRNDGKTWWECRCECGNIKSVLGHQLREGKCKSCGCYSADKAREKFTTHGLSNSRLYSIHNAMNARCFNKNNKEYHNYGGRGVSVCEEWRGRKGFLSFYKWAISNGYKEELSIDRVDNNKNYSPDNCRWVTPKEQAINRRTNVFISYNGETKTLKEWSDSLGIPYKTLHMRIKKYQWDIERAFIQPINIKKGRK